MPELTALVTFCKHHLRPGRPGVWAVAAACARLVARVGLGAGLLLLLLMAGAVGPAAADASSDASGKNTPRLATLDWGIAQNLTAMGVPPIAVGQTAGYATWVGAPPLPAKTRDLGLRAQPNLELLSQLEPDRILITEMYRAIEPKLERVAPVSTVDVYFTPGPVWHNTVAAARKLGRIAGRPEAAEALIRRTKKNIRDAAARLPANTAPLLVVQFADFRHVRIYGRGSLIQATMRRMGLENAWHGKTTRWGMAVVPLSRLAQIENGRVVVMGPVPVGVTDEIAASRLWRSLPVVGNAPVVYIPEVWSFGGLPSASRFARLVAGALRSAPASGLGWPRQPAGGS
ncbi:iron-siderophore ABC transporter substrate-binding protein [Salinisphaera sp.]|uniref:iron-siderophore ABC transporter substrate-binding protein n=1 Tax=Salinisphaera sp. TaxID=1914330 RepID=UPI002D780D58|nr:iron-siderophore ABC transporter substrate-binding protein [Salinisphaera sp.]HET7312745.1 iron-siderophore ABC transporter substrate-binding protein [Salinisphaera sp.]